MNPDYDAYGSQFGLYYALKEAFPNKTILLDGDDNDSNFYNVKMDHLSEKDYENSLVILVDQSSLLMLKDENFRRASKMIIIDHHESTPDFGDVVLIRPNYSSASELVTEFLFTEGLPITEQSANALFIGIVGDSNRFLYSGTSANTFKMCEILIESGADIIADYKIMQKEETENQKRFKGFILSSFIIEGDVAYNIVSKEERSKYGIDAFFSSRGSVNLLSGIINTKAFVNFTETDDSKYYVEIRSKEIPVVNVAKAFGGGGHELACGTTIGSFGQISNIIKALNEEVNKSA